MSVFDRTLVQINGPINVIRMEGKIGGIPKVIYIFMDRHVNITDQTKCDNVFAKNIDTYFAENFHNLNDSEITYDFFLEIVPNKLQNISFGLPFQSDANYQDIYIREIWRLFRKMFQYDPKKNKVSISEYFRNVRLHFMDIREYINRDYMEKLINIHTEIDNMLSQNQFNLEELDSIVETIRSFKVHCLKLIDALKKIKQNKNPPRKRIINPSKISDPMEHIYYLFHKCFMKYSNKNIQRKLWKQIPVLNKYLHELVSESDNLLKLIIDNINYDVENHNKLNFYGDAVVKYNYGIPSIIMDNMIIEMKHKAELLYDKFVFFFTRFMDVYFLRRFLDKNYITNAITYTGAYHSTVYIELLSKEFGFKISHFHFANETNINKLNQLIHKTNAEEMGALFYPSISSQCSDLTYFPKDFL